MTPADHGMLAYWRAVLAEPLRHETHEQRAVRVARYIGAWVDFRDAGVGS